MPIITIDGKPCAFEGKPTVLQVALAHGVEIPRYCYHEGLSIVASCRICLAEIATPNPRNEGKLELIPKLMPTCQTLVQDGMCVYTKSPKSIANQKAVMEYLLINHPLDCPVCDQAGECLLQDYSYRYGRAESRFREDKIKQPTKDIGPHVKLYADRCIMCSQCVRFTKEVTGTNELGVFGRGNHEQIDIFPGRALDNELSGNVVDLCPVGALLDKDFLFEQRVWFLHETPSIDGLTASGDNIWVHHNEGRVFRVKPRRNLDVNKWWISDEVRYGWKFVHADERLTQPKRLQMGDAMDADWPRAIRAAAMGLKTAVKEGGPGALALMVSPMLSCEEAYLWGQLVRGLDPQATLAVGPVPRHGEDKTFPGGFTVHAEKCPNARGVRRALSPRPLGEVGERSAPGEGASGLSVRDDHTTTSRPPSPGSQGSPTAPGGTGEILTYDDFLQRLTDKKSPINAVILTGNYPSPWATPDLTKALGKRFVVLIDTLPNDLTRKADVLLPGATWVEKEGTFENAAQRLQTFRQAIPPPEGARPEAQIALDLQAACGLAPHQRFNAARTREQMAGLFLTDVYHPAPERAQEPDMQYVEM